MKYKTQTEQRIDCLAHDISHHHGQICMLNKMIKELTDKRTSIINEKNRLENNLMLEQGYKESEDFLVMEEENNIKLIKDKG